MDEMETTATGATSGAQPHHPRRWWILAVICLAQLMDVLDVTIVNIALPDAQKELAFSVGDRQWIVTAYSLAFGSLLLLFGRVSDLVGRRVMFLAGLIAFGAASALGGAAPNFEVLVTGRALQGAAGAMLAPAALSLLSTSFTEAKERAAAFAVFGGVSGSGAAIGMLLGGVLTECLNWRWTLFVNVVISLVAVVGAATLIPRQPKTDDRPHVDLPGTLIASVALCCVVYGFANVESHPWSAPGTWVSLAGGALLLAVFVWWQTSAAHPLLPLRVILDRTRGGSNLAIFLGGIGLFGAFLFLNYYMQEILRYSPVMTGIAFLPMVATLVITGGVCTTQLYPRIGAKIPVCGGMIIAAGGMAWLTGISPHSSYSANILGPLMLFGIGIGAIIAPAMNAGTSGVEPHDAGVASAMVNIAQQIGGSIGIALLNSLAASALTRYLIGKDVTSQIVQADAAIHSYAVAFWYSSAIFTAGAVACGLTLRAGKPEPVNPDSPG
ncbi:MFS transporter [Amycolatopsis acidiphila]|uniref:MFS transporter n=1 Tax=Amycolatopsis acidiphila TaxID=715473 RepID=A0A558ANW4_9PSEU|nr:MFS transporter [Amycolatopsis acidiphila]TVT25946.1 MFS transporter [Amycolatopsis acidiphila]UIJ63346.1 MFS transporter [Amycolatopsis acidiphila]GHG75123.1 MFS transporter [Amycolatopsis acidiphila]